MLAVAQGSRVLERGFLFVQIQDRLGNLTHHLAPGMALRLLSRFVAGNPT